MSRRTISYKQNAGHKGRCYFETESRTDIVSGAESGKRITVCSLTTDERYDGYISILAKIVPAASVYLWSAAAGSETSARAS